MTTYFYVDYPNGNEACGKTHMVMTDNPTEIELAKVRYGRVFFNKPEADAFAKLPKPKRVRHLTDEERKQWELEQMAYGKSQTPVREKAITEMTPYERLVAEFEFAAQYENWSETEYRRKRKAFDSRHWYERKQYERASA